MTSEILSRRSLAAMALGLLDAGAASGCAPSAETNPPAEVGTTRGLDSPGLDGASFTVAMPDGTYTVTGVGVHESAGPEASPLRAPEGAVVITLDVGSAERTGSGQLVRTRTTFQVAAGGETHDLGGPVPTGGAGVVVPGDGSDAVIEVVHEGRVARFAVSDGERLDEEPLYAATDPETIREELPIEDLVDGDLWTAPEFSAELVHSTFSTMAGWAPAGSAWLEARGLGISRQGTVVRGRRTPDVVTTITASRLVVDGDAVDTETGALEDSLQFAWVQVPLGALEAAVEITYDVEIDGSVIATDLTRTVDAGELAALTV
ncbi:hypothetical protein ACT3SP_05135 [Brachybacterium sp. AOP43-C2-M15]|uniref:hypothetical protein n=1 Tax=Brachybacterium sp. AOP43-C2-M15 TaxID=3457661 RepID=UPI004033C97E